MLTAPALTVFSAAAAVLLDWLMAETVPLFVALSEAPLSTRVSTTALANAFTVASAAENPKLNATLSAVATAPLLVRKPDTSWLCSAITSTLPPDEVLVRSAFAATLALTVGVWVALPSAIDNPMTPAALALEASAFVRPMNEPRTWTLPAAVMLAKPPTSARTADC